MLSKRSIILDSLSTHRIDEGMIDSISKNSSSGSGDKLLKALLDCDMRTIPNKNLKSTTSFYNKSPFSEVDLIVKYEKLPSNDGRKCYIYHLNKGKKHYISISASSYNNNLDGLSRLFIYEAKDESVVDSKLKLPTLGCRFKIEFASNGDAKDFYKKIRGIGVEKWVNRVKIMGGTIVLECF